MAIGPNSTFIIVSDTNFNLNTIFDLDDTRGKVMIGKNPGIALEKLRQNLLGNIFSDGQFKKDTIAAGGPTTSLHSIILIHIDLIMLSEELVVMLAFWSLPSHDLHPNIHFSYISS